MGENSKIQWTDHTYNPWRGCTKVSAGCAHCYAETLSKRNPAVLGHWGRGAERVLSADSYRNLPYRWNREAKAAGERRRVFALSLGDWLDDEVPLEFQFGLLCDIRDNDALDWLLLTKRPQNWRPLLQKVAARFRTEFVRRWLNGDAPQHVWLGVSIEDQQTADERIPWLLELPAVVRFVSYEPALGPVDLHRILVHEPTDENDPSVILDALTGHIAGPDDRIARLAWVIAGGESGPHARPAHPEWFRSVRDQCAAAGVPFFFKQHGEWLATEFSTLDQDELRGQMAWVNRDGQYVKRVRERDLLRGFEHVRRIGKRVAGRLLDGVEHNGFPEVRS